ncbi:TonB-dependent receptor [Paraflavitalea sp. CAU 1676]|uniref:SusC/RagA family TonB-linked outer membrane protein n=1 Tax=Paraflavitalea sp. CAU 1676 TaxID=3032598 RepID=UPI0023DB7473|nr:TonB-dependent receptor [Paraflavitalea sp. CAU 1676]MDF2192290.1 TonB-dependent receptor [Paraflavitalea sp. CAU 1676]
MTFLVTHHLHKMAVSSRLYPGKVIAIVLSVLAAITLAVPVYAQTDIRVKGRITGPGAQPVPRASVTVKGSTVGTSSDDLGNFEITVASNGTLVISSVGFAAREVAVNGQTTLNVSLAATTDLGEVVVVGYGTQRKRDVTGATVNVSEKALRDVPVPNIQQALIGRAAGLEIQQVGNQPGAGAQIRIRGTRSISGLNEPLYVLDGIPWDGNLNDINPDDVASVDILKDASSTAIYGSRGANGVILLTTKKGRTGETRLSYNGYYGIGSATNKFPVYNAQEYQAMRNASSWATGYLPEEQNGISLGRNTDWQDLMYENSMRTNHNISILGGRDGNSYSLGGGYYKETTLMPGEDFTRGSLRATIDFKVGKRLKAGLNTMNSMSYARGSQFVSGSAIFRMLANSPLMPAYKADGSVYLLPNSNVDDNNAGVYNPLLLKGDKTWDDRVRRIRTFNSLYAEYEFIKGLKYRINVGLSFAQEFGGQFRNHDDTAAGRPSYFRPSQGNLARVANGEAWGYTLENLLYYDKTIGDHKINFTGLYSVQESQSFSNFIQKDSITEDFVKFYNLALSTPVNSQNTSVGGAESRWALISYMARLNYAYKDRYLLTATFRRDGSSRLAPGNQWFNYPAVSAGWMLSEESFLQNVKQLSLLKLRVGWGRTSNQAINPYDSKGLVNNSNGLPAGNTGGNITRYNFGPTIVTGYNVVTLPNPNLSWEFTSTTNIGVDFGLLNNRITGSMEYYISKTNDILYNVNLPVTSGVAGGFATNIGEMENKGFEFAASADVINSRSGFNWSVDLNFFWNNNKLVKISDNVTQDIGSQLFVGQSMTALYDFKKLGVWQLEEAEQAAAAGSSPGQLKILDYSGPNGKPDGVINTTYDRHVIGDMDADFQGGITNRFSYKGFDLSAVITARFGGLLVSQVHQPLASYISILDGRRNAIKVDYWTPNNPTNWFPIPQATTSGDTWRTLGYYDASYVRIRSINLGYTFGKDLLKRMNVQGARLYFTIDNVGILYSPYFDKTGLDPQATASGDRGVGGVLNNLRQNDRGNGALVVGLSTPPRRTFTLGVNLSF